MEKITTHDTHNLEETVGISVSHNENKGLVNLAFLDHFKMSRETQSVTLLMCL